MEPIELSDRLGRWSSGRGRLSALLAQRLRELIDDGALRAGETLPTDRALAARLAVGRSTVVAAYETLRGDGRIVRRQGSGTQVAGEPEPVEREYPVQDTMAPIFLQRVEPPTGVLQMACAAPSTPPPELLDAQQIALDEIRESAGASVDQGYYPAGHPRLRQAVAEHFGRLGLATDCDQVLITNGAQQAISLLVRTMITPGDRALVEAPTYPGALEVLRAAGADVVPQPVGMPRLSTAVADGPVALAYTVPTFHNPTGAVLGPLQGQRLARTAERTGTWLIDDRTMADMAFPGVRTPPPLACHSDKVITVGSLSKAVWGGLRIGWVRAPRSLIDRLARVRALHDLGGTVFSQAAAAIMIDRLAELCRRQAPALQQRHDQLCELLTDRLPDWTFQPVTGGQFLWVQLPYGDGDSFAQHAFRHGVAVLPGRGLDPVGGVDRLRLHFQLPAPMITQSIDRLGAAWHSYRPPAEPLVERPKLAV